MRGSGNNGGYADFTASTAIALARGSNAASLVPGFRSGAYTESWRIWIAFNHDSVSSDTEIVDSGAPPTCGTFSYGEVEDYTVQIP